MSDKYTETVKVSQNELVAGHAQPSEDQAVRQKKTTTDSMGEVLFEIFVRPFLPPHRANDSVLDVELARQNYRFHMLRYLFIMYLILRFVDYCVGGSGESMSIVLLIGRLLEALQRAGVMLLRLPQ
jgi:hypothetical protein